MRWPGWVVLASCWAAALAGNPDKEGGIRFTKADLGSLPAGWETQRTGPGAGSIWKVIADDTAPSQGGVVLAQTAAGPAALFNLCIGPDVHGADVEVAVAFKAIRRELDQGGGLVWRYQDANNYYVARMNPLEDNYRLYKVVAGKRTQLAGKESVKVPAGTWHTLKVRQIGNRIECFLDNRKLIEATDDTFAKAGKVGLWTRADAQTAFDQFRARDPAR